MRKVRREQIEETRICHSAFRGYPDERAAGYPGLGEAARLDRPHVDDTSAHSRIGQGKVRGGKWHTLIDKVYALETLSVAARRVVFKDGAAGVDHQTADNFSEHDLAEIQRLHEHLRQDSPLLSNVYLNPLDHHMSDLNYQMVRYADDFVILCRTADEAQAALAEVQQWVTTHGLTLHPTKTQIVDSRDQSFSFPGYSFRGHLRFPRAKSNAKLQDRLRDLTPRKSGGSLQCTIQNLNSVLRGWFGYFRHCHPSVFWSIDEHLRARLRRLLLKRHRRNPKRLSRNQRWPNSFFTEYGLYNLGAAHLGLVQSLLGNN